MKTFKGILSLLAFVLCTTANAQLINMNPDPNGPVWITGDMAPGQPASIDWDFVELTPDANSQLMALPLSVDNSQKPWFP